MDMNEPRAPFEPLVLSAADVAALTGQSTKQVYRWEATGQMPRPITLPGRGTGKRPRLHWRRKDILKWIEDDFRVIDRQ